MSTTVQLQFCIANRSILPFLFPPYLRTLGQQQKSVSPETVIIPIVSCIIGFPILALLVICCLRRRAKLARDRDRRRNIDLQDHAVSLAPHGTALTPECVSTQK
uniref:Uncharacterized protein n=1 Tax=Anopheles culicifacies TaxID=139723 RepID=A0A182LVQ6_9DIPT